MMKIEIYGNLEDVVRELLKYKEIGIDVYCDFNKHKLYSRNVTLDSAYLEVTGYTYQEFLRRKRESIEKWRKEQEEEKERNKAKKPEWIKRGRKLIDEALWSEWERCIDIRINDLYNGMEVECALQIMEAYENNTPIEEISKQIESQGHSGASYGMLKSIIINFYRRGNELFQKLSEFEETPNNGKRF